MRLQDEHSSHASTPTRLRQFIAFASSSANTFLPIPSSPVNSSEPGTRPLTSRCRSDSFTSSLPMSVENMFTSKPLPHYPDPHGWLCPTTPEPLPYRRASAPP